MGNSQGRSGSGGGRPVPEGANSGRGGRGGGGGGSGGGIGFPRPHSNDSMTHSPPDSPSSAARSPVMFTPQIPMVPIPKGDELSLGAAAVYAGGGAVNPASVYSGTGGVGGASEVEAEPGIATMITWTHGAEHHVFVEGSWDNWTTRQALQRAGKDFTIVKLLPPGIYQYKFIVDDVWHYAPDLPAVYDEMGNVNNVLEVQEYVPENFDNVAGFESPRSPESTYTSPMPAAEDFAKEPPLVPPHLQLTLLNVPLWHEAPTTLPRPQHVILNHLYVEKGKAARSVLALGLTHRFRSKYVTVVLYKPLHR